jgi:hypothetical protein
MTLKESKGMVYKTKSKKETKSYPQATTQRGSLLIFRYVSFPYFFFKNKIFIDKNNILQDDL